MDRQAYEGGVLGGGGVRRVGMVFTFYLFGVEGGGLNECVVVWCVVLWCVVLWELWDGGQQ